MLVHQRPLRSAFFRDRQPNFPAASCVITAQLGPAEVFGKAPPSGRLRTIAGKQAEVSHQPFHGGIVGTSTERLPIQNAQLSFFGLDLQISGDIAEVSAPAQSVEALHERIGLIADHLPGFLAVILKEAIAIEDMFGDVSGSYFEVRVVGDFFYAVQIIDPAKPRFDAIDGLGAKGPETRRIAAACRYLNQTLWLRYSSQYPGHFAAEQILNLAKCLQALIPHDSVDTLRVQLDKLRLKPELCDCIAAITYVRNQLDVGHVKLSALSANQYRDFHHFAQVALEVVQWLVRHVAAVAYSGTHVLPPSREHAESRSADGTMRRVAAILPRIDTSRLSDYVLPDS